MKRPYRTSSLKENCLSIVTAVAVGGFTQTPTIQAQIVPDSTLPLNSVVTQDGNQFVINGGSTSGGNLFHSFEQFNVPTGSSAVFNNGLDIQNIFSRVTGGLVSTIDGLIQANGSANLFVINPNGIIFGPNALLDVGGSFLASTAHQINFVDGTQFAAKSDSGQNAGSTALLTVSVPIGLQYGNNPAPIQVQGTTLQVQPGKTLALVGGDVAIAGGTLTASGGRVDLSALAGGTLRLNLNGTNLSVSLADETPGISPPPRADISLTEKAQISVIADNGGSISLQAGNIEVSGESQIVGGIQTLLGAATSQAGNIDLNATGTISLTQSSAIGNQIGFNATGNGGNINMIGESLSMSGGAQVSAIAFGQGNAGRVSVRVNNTVELSDFQTGIFSTVESGNSNSQAFTGVGNSGGIEIEARSLLMQNGAQLQSSSSGRGNAGMVSVRSHENVTLSGANTAIFNQVEFAGVGNSEGIEIQARSLSMTEGVQLSTNNIGQGNAGEVSIQVRESIVLSGTNTSIFSNVSSGNSGGIAIDTGSLSAIDGAQLQAIASGSGEAGAIEVRASDSISLQGPDTSIFSAVGRTAVGANSGGITLQGRSLFLRDGAKLISATFGIGNAGPVSVQVREQLSLSGANTVIFSSVGPLFFDPLTTPNPTAIGDSAGIEIRARSLSLSEGAQITASTFDFQQGNAGNISIQVEDAIALVGNSQRETPIPSDPSIPVMGVEAVRVVEPLLSIPPSGSEEPILTPPSPTTPPPPRVTEPPLPPILGRTGASTGIYSTVETGARGNAGDIEIQSNVLSIAGGAQVQTLTRGQGNSGDLRVRVSEVVLDGVNALGDFSGLASTVELGAVGEAGDIEIQSNVLSVTGGAGIQALTRGEGDSGNIQIWASEVVTLRGGNPDGSFFSGVFTSTEAEAEGRGGQVSIATEELRISDGAVVSARSTSAFPGGEITVDVNRLTLSQGSEILTSATETGAAGSIEIQGRERVTLDEGAKLSAETASGDRGNIVVRSRDLILRKNSVISTNATGTASGGNIAIATDNLVGIDNSDISANAERGSGGQAIVNAQGIFGIQSRRSGSPTTSDITATSANGPQFDGIVDINTPEIDPSSGLVELPERVVDVTSLIARDCGDNRSPMNTFYMTGRGGLPQSPSDALTGESSLVDLGDRTGQSETSGRDRRSRERDNLISAEYNRSSPLVEARGWAIDDRGRVVLTAESPAIATAHFNPIADSCYGR